MSGRFLYKEVKIRSRGYLPHWEVQNGIYSITFREKNSLPPHVIIRLREDRRAIQRTICGDREPTFLERTIIEESFAMRLDAELDVRHAGGRVAEIANDIAAALHFFDRQRYDLVAWCVMPNHVHVVATLRESLAKTLHSWKSFLAHQAGEELWAREYFDRLIRDEKDLERTVAYVRDNPRKAGLMNWPWVG